MNYGNLYEFFGLQFAVTQFFMRLSAESEKLYMWAPHCGNDIPISDESNGDTVKFHHSASVSKEIPLVRHLILLPENSFVAIDILSIRITSP